QRLAHQEIDLLFLDIHMPELTGLELLKVLKNVPKAIIITAYPDYAVQGFELDVIDYLIKPVAKDRFIKALDKLRQRMLIESSRNIDEKKFIILKVERENRKFYLEDIRFFEAFGNYVKLWESQKKTLINSTLKQLLVDLPKNQFTQIHKSYVVNNSKVKAFDKQKVILIDGHQIKIGSTFRKKSEEVFK
ncbi:MAG: LytTR family DNA-binding domain-containing protein, partial [Pseudomonadota bacterium]